MLTRALTFSSLALQYEPHTEPRSFNMMRKKGPSFPHQSLFPTTSFFGCIAQLVEHWAFNLMVAGSSPAIPKPALHSTMSKEKFVPSKMTLWPLDSLRRLRPLSDKGVR